VYSVYITNVILQRSKPHVARTICLFPHKNNGIKCSDVGGTSYVNKEPETVHITIHNCKITFRMIVWNKSNQQTNCEITSCFVMLLCYSCVMIHY